MPILAPQTTTPPSPSVRAGDGWQITLPLSERTSASGRDSGTFPVAIDGREYLVDLTSNRYRRTSVDLLRTRTNSEPNENLLLAPEVWRVARQSLHGGAGQTQRDRGESSDVRFNASKNINPWEQWQVSLLHGTQRVRESNGLNQRCISVASGFLLLDGTLLLHYASIGSEPSTLDLVQEPVDWTTDGSSVYLAFGGGDVAVVDVPTMNRSAFATLPGLPGMLTYMKGLLVASVGPSLYDISGGVADDTTKFYEHPIPGHEWVTGTDGLASGYLLGGQGSRWLVYSVSVAEDGSTFAPPVVAAPLPDGETGLALGSYLGNILIGTSGGVRFAAPSDNGSLVYGRLIRTGTPVTSFAGRDRFVWFGVGGAASRDDTIPLAQPEAGLARMDLSTMTSEFTPAYASDLVADGEPAATASGVAIDGDRAVFTVPGHGLYAETGEYAAEGWLRDGAITMGVQDTKMGLYINVVTLPLSGEVEVTARLDGGAEDRPLLSLSGGGAVTSGNHYIGEQFRSIETTMYLRPDGESPVVTYAELRAVPTNGAAHQWEVPLQIADSTSWENSVMSKDTTSDLDVVLQLVESGRLFTFREGTRVETCYATKYEWFPTSIVDSGGPTWQGVCVVTIRSVR